MTTPRFIRNPEEDEPNVRYPEYSQLCWLDTERNKRMLLPINKDPNQFIRHTHMRLLFTDQAEYHVVCFNCYSLYQQMQWSGSTRNPGWRDQSGRYLAEHIETKGWCEFCDPIFGNGGWSPF